MSVGSSASMSPVGVQESRTLIEQANHGGDLQTAFSTTALPQPESPEWLMTFLAWVGGLIQAVGKWLAPLGPFAPIIVYSLAGIVIILILIPIIRMLIHTPLGRYFTGRNLTGEVAWRPTAAAAAALLADIDALAQAGRFDEAAHLLLLRSVADINAFRPDLVKVHYSSREIGSHPLLPESARPAFARIVRWVEQSYFAGVPVGRAGFDDCRAAYVEFIRAEGIA